MLSEWWLWPLLFGAVGDIAVKLVQYVPSRGEDCDGGRQKSAGLWVSPEPGTEEVHHRAVAGCKPRRGMFS